MLTSNFLLRAFPLPAKRKNPITIFTSSAKAGMRFDGPAASGKSTAAKLLAQELGIAFLDTGAMYRAVTLAGMQQGIDLDDEDALARVAEEADIQLVPQPKPDGFPVKRLQVLLNGDDVSQAIRENEVSRNARHAASNGRVRAILVEAQREYGRRWGSLVTEGRDQGSVVFPDAEVKIYLDCSAEVRAQRRADELAERGQDVPVEQIRVEIVSRDASDH